MKITGILLSLTFIASTASAQIERKPVVVKSDSVQITRKGNNGQQQSRKERYKELNLTREQKGMMKELMQANKSAKEAIANNTQLSEQDKQKQIRALQKVQMQQIQAILTPEQRETFKASKPNNP